MNENFGHNKVEYKEPDPTKKVLAAFKAYESYNNEYYSDQETKSPLVTGNINETVRGLEHYLNNSISYEEIKELHMGPLHDVGIDIIPVENETKPDDDPIVLDIEVANLKKFCEFLHTYWRPSQINKERIELLDAVYKSIFQDINMLYSESKGDSNGVFYSSPIIDRMLFVDDLLEETARLFPEDVKENENYYSLREIKKWYDEGELNTFIDLMAYHLWVSSTDFIENNWNYYITGKNATLEQFRKQWSEMISVIRASTSNQELFEGACRVFEEAFGRIKTRFLSTPEELDDPKWKIALDANDQVQRMKLDL